jgi:hypothetical protein
VNLPQEPGTPRASARRSPIAIRAARAAAIVAAIALPAYLWFARPVETAGEAAAAATSAPTSASAAPATAQRVSITPATFDLGDVFMDVDEVPMSFTVTNQGERVAVVTYIETSCDCTSAALVVDGREGPRFKMGHDTPPGTFDWRAVLAPGEEATLMVYYNPQAHGVATPAEAPRIHGPATRLVRLHADDATRPYAVDLRIDLNQRH